MRTNDTRTGRAWRRGMATMLLALLAGCSSQEQWDDFWQHILERISPSEQPVTAPSEDPPTSPSGVAALPLPPSAPTAG